MKNIFTLLFITILFPDFLSAQNDCNVSPISGSPVIFGGGKISQTYSVTSNGEHEWILPSGEVITTTEEKNSVTVHFEPTFTKGILSVRKANCQAMQSLTIQRIDCYIEINAGEDKIVYSGLESMECVELSAEINGSAPPFRVKWSDGQSGSTISVCPEQSAIYRAEVSDSTGCTTSDEIMVCVVDVKDGNKIKMCDNGTRVSIDPLLVNYYLEKGFSLGDCNEMNNCKDKEVNTSSSLDEIMIYPDPDHPGLIIETPANLVGTDFQLVDYNNNIVYRGIFNSQKISLNIDRFGPGIYFLKTEHDKNGGPEIKLIIE